MTNLSILSYRKILNEAQNINHEHNQFIVEIWAFYSKYFGEDDSLFKELQKRYDETYFNHKMIMAGQQYLNEVEKLRQLELSIC